MTATKPRIVVIAGPTASGKSSLAVEVARRISGEILNADSMQVYRGMDIGTAKPSPREMQGVPHHLFDVVSPDEAFNAALYRARAVPIIEALAAKGATPLVVGGTGLYIKSLLGGLLDCPSSDPLLRRTLVRDMEEEGKAALHDRLRRLDPETAGRVHPNDRVRILRALEIILSTGKPLSQLIRVHGFGERAFEALKIYLKLDREDLYHRIDRRCERMLEEGLIEETRALLDKGYSAGLKPMKSLGYRHAVNFIEGRWDAEETLRLLKRDTRRYAKRQLTWFRRDSEAHWAGSAEADGIIEKIEAFLKNP